MKPSSRICVAVRKRPAGADEKDVISCNVPGAFLIVNEPKIKYDLTPYTEKHSFAFDEVFDERSSNRDVYNRAALPLVEHIFAGLGANSGDRSPPSSACFAYGQTGAGKSYTLLGKPDREPGIYLMAAHDIFTRCARAPGRSLAVFVSFYEIYGRKLFDLLNERAKLICREDGDKVIQICGLTEHPVQSVEQMVDVIDAGNALRAAGQTSANAESSRSHAVLLMEVRDLRDQRPVGRISFIDLAGNERGSDTFDCDRKTRLEGAEINKSLLALKECIRSLGMGKNHVPFRGSILTEVLRDSFLGNSRTTMLAAISPLAHNCEHSLNTLRYTTRVKEIGPAGGKRKSGANAAAAMAAAVAAQAQAEEEAAAIAARGSRPLGAGAAAAAKGEPSSKAMRMAERLAMEAIASNGGGDVSSRDVIGGAAPAKLGGANSAAVAANNNNKPVPKQGRRAVGGGGGAAAVPAAVAPSGGLANRRGGSNVGAVANRNGGNNKGNANRRADAPLDPIVATIVESHVKDLDEIDAEAGADDDDDEEDVDDEDDDDGSNADDQARQRQQQAQQRRENLGSSFRKVRAVHAHIVSRIRASEESVLQMHRRHIDHKMAMMKGEVAHLQELDESSRIDDYVDTVDALLEREAAEIAAMRERLAQIRNMLREEEVLSKTLTPAGKRQQNRPI